MNYNKLFLTIFILQCYLSSGLAQTKIQSSAQSTAGRLITSTSFSANIIVGQSTPVGNIKSSSYSISSGFSYTINNIFRSISLISPNGSEILLAGSSINIEWNAAHISNIKLDYSLNNGTDWITLEESIDASLSNYSWILPNTESDQCLLQVLDASNIAIFDESDDTFEIFSYPNSIPISISISFGDFTKTESFRMIGFPGDIDIPMDQIITGEPGTDWKAAYDNGAANNYLIEFDGSEDFNLRPGRGFILHSKNGVSFNQNSSSVGIDDNFQYSIPLHNGWNIISNPFDKIINWSNIQVVNSISEDIHYFNGGYNLSNQLEPYKGYYFYNATILDNLTIPYISSSNENSLTVLQKANIPSRILDLVLSENDIQKSKVTIGYNKLAHSAYDTFDKFAPPSDFESASIRSYNKDLESNYKYLRTDIRSEIGEGQTYELDIKLPQSTKIKLNTLGVENFENSEIYLVDKRLNKFYNLKTQLSIILESLHSQNNYQVLIGDNIFIENKKSLLLPKNFNLSQNYPNPFNPTTIIRYTLPREGKANITLYNLLGEEIHTIFDGYNDIGTYELLFDASSLASGVYFYTLISQNYSDTKKMVLLK